MIEPAYHAAAQNVLHTLSLIGESLFSDTLDVLRNCQETISIVNKILEKEPEYKRYSQTDDFRRNVKSLRQFFFKAIAAVKPKAHHLLFIDGIDVRPSNTPYDQYLEIVKALVNAVWTLNSERLNNLPERYLRVVLLIRPDILEGVGLQNLNNKIRDNSVVLDWKTTYPHYRSSKLFRLADRMLATQQTDLKEFEIGATWDHYFPYKVFNPRRDTDEPTDASFMRFLRYSFYRPRDIITLMDKMRKRMIDTGRGDATSFPKELIQDYRVLEEYSAYLLGEVKDSLSFYYNVSDYELFLKFFEFLDEFIDGRTREFNYDNFIVAYKHLVKYAETNKWEVPVIFASADRLLQFLYELNIVSFYSHEDGKRSPYARWCFRERSYANIRPKVKAGCRYKMHFGIARALNSTRFG